MYQVNHVVREENYVADYLYKLHLAYSNEYLVLDFLPRGSQL